MSATATKPATQVIAGPVRLSYLNVFKAREGLGGTPEFSVTLLIPKQPTKYCPDPASILKEINAAVKAAVEKKFGGTKPAGFSHPLKDGDEPDAEGNPKEEGYWFIRAKCKEEWPPVTVDGSGQVVTPQMGWKSGDWGRVSLSMYGYDQRGNKGVAAGLRAVQFLYVDDALGSAQDPASVAAQFGTVADAQKPSNGFTPATEEYDPFADE